MDKKLHQPGVANPGEMVALAYLYLLSVAMLFKVKEAFLQDGGYRILSRLAGQNEDVALGWLDRFHFFSLDIFLLLGAIPLALVCLSRMIRGTVFARAVLLLSLALIGLSFVNVNALGATGKFLSLDQVKPMLEWVRESPASFFDYVSVGALLRLALLLLGIAGIYRYRRSRLFAEFTPGPRLILCTLGTFNLLALYAGHAQSMPTTNFDTPALVQMWRALVPSATAVSLQDRQQESDKLAFHCEPGALQTGKGANPGKRNFILFIMETLPYDVFSRGHGSEFATFDDMRRSGYTALHHYSSYPFTSYARFSIFTGLYPSYRLEKTLPLGGPHPYQSFFSSLVGDGYDFKVFDPVTTRYEVDDWLIKQMAGVVLDAGGGDSVPQKDQLVLDKLIDNISVAAAHKKPFAYAYLPQLTHGPWLPAGATKEQLYSEGLDRLKQLDKSLATIVAVLKQKGLYQDTVIVITADHGLRTRKEAGFLKTTVLNDVSYHVPMIIHDPLMKRAVTINTVTSHLDISPTLQCLYRAGAPAIETQGKVMTMTAPGKQTIFFGGAWYNGSDGMWDGKGFYSFNRQLDMMWKSERFDFDEARPLQASPLSKSVAKVFEHQGIVQEALLSH